MSETHLDAYCHRFAQVYDIITGHKDYVGETSRLHEILSERLATHAELLDLGCGTGLHSVELSRYGYSVTGLDLSEGMIRSAREKSSDCTFIAGNICDQAGLGPFDACVCLFNVVNCLETTSDLIDFLKAAARVLRPEGLLICECWNPIAIIQEPPSHVTRTYSGQGFDITRAVTPYIDLMALTLRLDYDITLKAQQPVSEEERFVVRHYLRLFTPTEMTDSLMQAGFSDISIQTALPDFGEAGPRDRMLAFRAVRK